MDSVGECEWDGENILGRIGRAEDIGLIVLVITEQLGIGKIRQI